MELGLNFNYSDAAEAHILAVQKLLYAAQTSDPIPEHLRVDGEAFFLSNDDPRSFWSGARYISNPAGYSISEKDFWKIPLGLVRFLMTVWEWIFWAFTAGGTPQVTVKMLRYTTQTRNFDNTKAKKRLGYVPRVSIEEGLRRGVEWHLNRDKENGKNADKVKVI